MPSPFDRWSLVGLPTLNRAIIAGHEPADALIRALNPLLATLPEPATLSPVQAERLVVHLSLSGASVARHYQEEDLSRKLTPERGFDPLAVGPARSGFQEYFARVARRTGTGHYERDSYAGLVRWNAPKTEVHWHGERIAVVPGSFDDGEVRTYTGDPGEWVFFELLKRSEALELAINDLIDPLSSGAVEVASPEAVRRMRSATTLLGALRQISTDFAALPPGVGLAPDHFLDVFRQFAVHWKTGDIPPSGAQDPEFLKRDFLLGINYPDYELLVRRIFPALLDVERCVLSSLMERATVTDLVMRSAEVKPGDLAAAPPQALAQLARQHPALAACCLLLHANAAFSGTHLSLTKKFLFRQQKRRDAVGIPDSGLVSHLKGTTGMTESLLDRLTRARRDHPLSPLQQVGHADLVACTGIPDEPALAGPALAALVHFVAPDRSAQRVLG